MLEILLTVAVLALLIVALVLLQRMPARNAQLLEQQHRAMLADLHDALSRLGDRMVAAQGEQSEKQQAALHALRSEMMTQTMAKLAEQGREDQKLIQESFKNATLHLAGSVEALEKKVDARLEQISGRVSERLDEGFKKTNETFVSVMARLATIDEAQKKIDGLTTNVVSLQELLGDKRSRGAFGEVQLEALVRNSLPPDAYAFQHTLKS
ncbi:MAG TPA: DNA recombination protein RmuC, partial [Gallionellaceae bacterium]